MRAARITALAVLSAFSFCGAVSVWVPAQGQTASLTTEGLHLPGGRSLQLVEPSMTPQLEAQPLGNVLFLRRTEPREAWKPVSLDFLNAQGKVLSQVPLPARTSLYRAFATVRGPCYTLSRVVDPPPGKNGISVAGSPVMTTRCLSPDLGTEWARFQGQPLAITRGGGLAYVTTPPDDTQPYRKEIPVIRIDLRSGARTALALDAEAAEPDPANRRGVAETYGVRNFTFGWEELPGPRFLACMTLTMAKYGCRLDVLDRDAHFLFTLEGNAYNTVPSVSRDGQLLYAIGNTLQVWDARTGKRLRAIHDALWDKQNRYPVNAFLTPDGRRAAIVTGKSGPDGFPGQGSLTVFLYDLASGKQLSSFAVKGK